MTTSAINSETLNTDFILVGIPVVNDTLHAAAITCVRVRKPTEACGYGVVVEHGVQGFMILDCETRMEAHAHRSQIIRGWRAGLREHGRLVALLAAAAAANNKGAN